MSGRGKFRATQTVIIEKTFFAAGETRQMVIDNLNDQAAVATGNMDAVTKESIEWDDNDKSK